VLRAVDVDFDVPIMEIPHGLGTTFRTVKVFDVELLLLPPEGEHAEPLRWTVDLGARPAWGLPFGVLLGQRGWFEHFPTTIDAEATTVHLSA
jgi:hypothetical protein